jgi:hypothetical protein
MIIGEGILMRIQTFMSAALLVLAGAGAATATVRHVPGDFDHINDAVQAASAGDTVLVGAGTFTDCIHQCSPTDTTKTCVILRSGITLRGAGMESTIIDAGGLGRVLYLNGVTNVRIEDLQVTGAFAQVYGCGIYLRDVDASVRIERVKVFGNQDGGIIGVIAANFVAEDCAILENVNKQGGGIQLEDGSAAVIRSTLVDGNEAPAAAGVLTRNSDATIEGCVISNNSVTSPNGNGGGLLAINSALAMRDCEILGNTATGYGGGLAFQNCVGGLIEGTNVVGNVCAGDNSYGGGIHANSSTTAFTDVLVAQNQTLAPLGNGGGLDIQFTPSPTLTHCTIVENACGASRTGGGLVVRFGADPVIDKCIVAFSTQGAAFYSLSGAPTISCCDVYGNAGGDALIGTDAGGNFALDPLFLGETGYEYCLAWDSPCAPGNHPEGAAACAGEAIGYRRTDCGPTAVDELPRRGIADLGNHPNPFNPTTTIFFVLEKDGPARLRIYDLAGRILRTFAWSHRSAGRHEVDWDGRDASGRAVASGVYLYELEFEGRKLAERMSLIR